MILSIFALSGIDTISPCKWSDAHMGSHRLDSRIAVQPQYPSKSGLRVVFSSALPMTPSLSFRRSLSSFSYSFLFPRLFNDSLRTSSREDCAHLCWSVLYNCWVQYHHQLSLRKFYISLQAENPHVFVYSALLKGRLYASASRLMNYSNGLGPIVLMDQ